MTTTNSAEFWSLCQRYVYIRAGCEINPETNMPDDKNDWVIFDVNDVENCGTPTDPWNRTMVLWAMLDPYETLDCEDEDE